MTIWDNMQDREDTQKLSIEGLGHPSSGTRADEVRVSLEPVSYRSSMELYLKINGSLSSYYQQV